MGFYEDIAAALDAEGIESRIHDDVLFVPIAPELEIQFRQVATSGRLSAVTAAQVFVATPEGFDGEWDSDGTADGAGGADDIDEEVFDTALVGVVFSPEAALAEVVKHIATDEIVSIINDLLDGADDRVVDLEFIQDDIDPTLLICPVAVDSDLEVYLKIVDGQLSIEVLFVSYNKQYGGVEGTVEDTDGMEVAEGTARIVHDSAEMTREVLELGSFTDADGLFNALAVAAENAEEWEELLKPVGESVGTTPAGTLDN